MDAFESVGFIVGIVLALSILFLLIRLAIKRGLIKKK